LKRTVAWFSCIVDIYPFYAYKVFARNTKAAMVCPLRPLQENLEEFLHPYRYLWWQVYSV
jgi:hypothetical protein